jgi:hypothetical protein
VADLLSRPSSLKRETEGGTMKAKLRNGSVRLAIVGTAIMLAGSGAALAACPDASASIVPPIGGKELPVQPPS